MASTILHIVYEINFKFCQEIPSKTNNRNICIPKYEVNPLPIMHLDIRVQYESTYTVIKFGYIWHSDKTKKLRSDQFNNISFFNEHNKYIFQVLQKTFYELLNEEFIII